MAECIIAGRGSLQNQIPISPGYCTIVATVIDTEGNPVPDTVVKCKDGAAWYNYHTNSSGKVLFTCDSGSANITAYNYSVQSNIRYLDQTNSERYDIDAPKSTVINMNCYLKKETVIRFNHSTRYNNVEQMGSSSSNYLFDGYYKILTNSNVYVEVGGAGGAGDTGVNVSGTWYSGGGGGGGEYKTSNLQLSKNEMIKITVGDGYIHSGAGETSSFGTYLAANGGRSAVGNIGGVSGDGAGYFGNGATGVSRDLNRLIDGYNSNISNWGGGGGAATRNNSIRTNGGTPGGADGCYGRSYNGVLGGGGGGGSSISGYGSDGMVRITFY